ncbi:hypothetical protein IV500_04855 [Paeniglutamicibacter antarcticus]|uniref:Uncharacterized protein n=1 Tax=Arthrobacter terrae TaxID=2935737 RepID=A0A931G4F5_9MICC|nr:hypothetical protein [Arthrobacter terrae]MBG0738748.1 hypothetical protein [Arthrobacter terrae]
MVTNAANNLLDRPVRATGKHLVARTLIEHWGRPSVADGRVIIIDCMAAGCGFQSGHADLVGGDNIWAEHAYHVADVLEQAGVAETADAVANERLRLAGKLDEEVAHRNTLDRTRWNETTRGWSQAADHLRHPTATTD